MVKHKFGGSTSGGMVDPEPPTAKLDNKYESAAVAQDIQILK